MPRQTQGWCFTLNNPTDDEIDTLMQLDVQGCKAGLERGENGTLHVQGALYFRARHKKSLAACKKIFVRAHWEKMMGNWNDQKYCVGYHKPDPDGDWVLGKPGFLEVLRDDGTGPSRGKRVDLEELREMAEEGAPLVDMYEANFGSMVRYGKGIEKYRALKMAKLKCQVETVEWYYGPPGSGKTHTVHEKYPDAYEVAAPRTKDGAPWFDLYQDEETLFFNDYRDGWLSYETLLKLTEKVKGKKCVRFEYKGGVVCMPKLKNIVFTSVPSPRELLKDFDRQFERRCKFIEIKKAV